MFKDIIWNQNTILENVMQNNSNVRYVKDSEEYEVKVWIKWYKERPIMYDIEVEGAELIKATFERMNHSMWSYFEKNILDITIGRNEKDVITTYNFMKMRAFIVRWLLKGWSLPIELKKNVNGELTDECFKRVMNMHPRIIGYLVSSIESQIFISDDERGLITKQCSLLFLPNSPGVNNAHEAISLYCSLSSMWDKFGLNYFDLQRMPEDVIAKLKLVLGNETDFKNKQQKRSSHKKPNVTMGKNKRKPDVHNVATW